MGIFSIEVITLRNLEQSNVIGRLKLYRIQIKGECNMIICAFHSVNKMFAGNIIFNDLSFEINERDRIGLVGSNGSGKTTILKLIANIETADKGSISIKKGNKVGYLSQIPNFNEEWTCRNVLQSAFAEINKMAERLKQLEEQMTVEQDENQMIKCMNEYGLLQDRYLEMGGYEVESQIERVANGLGIQDLLSLSFIQASGGEQTKVSLAFILLQQPDLLLLDEPTNHLDISAVEWLENFVKTYPGTVIIVSHDRYFLDAVVNRIMDVEDGEITVYHQNYSGFVREKEKNLLVEFQQYQEQQKKIKKMKEAIKRLREWANRSNPPSEGLHKRATNMQRALDRLTKLKKPVLDRKKMNLQFEAEDRSGKDVVIMNDIAKIYDDEFLFHSIKLDLKYKERACIVGDNGTGKSTLLKMITSDVLPDGGELKLGSAVKMGYLSQHHSYENTSKTVLDVFREDVAVTEGEARHILAQFLFYGPAVFQRVGGLSGGERMRLRLAQLMHANINFLILDEPTNHLDIDSKEALETALEQFEGTILAVSHDRYFLNKMFHKTFWLENQIITTFDGSYEYAKKKWHELEVK